MSYISPPVDINDVFSRNEALFDSFIGTLGLGSS
jgi:hypothetical protein